MNGIREKIEMMRAVAPDAASSSIEVRNRALKNIHDSLPAEREHIFYENEKDLQRGRESGLSDAVMKRLLFDEHKLKDCAGGIEQLIGLEDPVGRRLLVRELDDDLLLEQVTCPIGIIGIIFEARPDALVQISSLCVKTGNCAVLKGGKETADTNRALFELIHDAVIRAGLPEHMLVLAETHEEIDELLSCHGSVDLLIPRGSNEFVSYIMDHTKIPVMGHSDGICHIYVDEYADREKALDIIIDAKTQYAAACNAVETVLVDRKTADTVIPYLVKGLNEAGVTVRGGEDVRGFEGIEPLTGRGYCEYLDLELSLKIVDGLKEAVEHINRYGSHHTDCIITEDRERADEFMDRVDSAGVYHNCSTRFADGFRYGFGAEVGISTGKIHARGPVGPDGLVTYKYRLRGSGNIVGDYQSGRRSFTHKDR